MRTPPDAEIGNKSSGAGSGMTTQTVTGARGLSKARERTLLVAGGGTAGHIHAGFAIAEAWLKRHGEFGRVIFLCSDGPIERKVLPREKYPYALIRLGSLNRVSRLTQLKTAMQLPAAFARSLSLLLKERPRAVIGVGGYASGPPVMLAGTIGRLWGCKAALLEQNAVLGLTNRLLKPFVRVIFSVFDELRNTLGQEHVVVTGNPIRTHFERLPSSAEGLVSDRAGAARLFVFGGSQGAVGMNTLVIEALPFFAELGRRVEIVHQTGETDYERVRAAHASAGTGARVEKFIYDMPEQYRAAHVIISRAGMSTLSELSAVGRASVLVPLPTAADNHQEKNARVYERAGAAFVAPQKATTGRALYEMVRELLEHPERLKKMEQAVTKFHRPDAARDVVAHLS